MPVIHGLEAHATARFACVYFCQRSKVPFAALIESNFKAYRRFNDRRKIRVDVGIFFVECRTVDHEGRSLVTLEPILHSIREAVAKALFQNEYIQIVFE